MAAQKQKIAKKILESKDQYTPKKFVGETYALISDPRLISKSISVGEQMSIATNLLIEILQQSSGSGGEKPPEKQNVAITIEPHPETDKKLSLLSKESLTFKKSVESAGIVELDPSELASVRPYLPIGFSPEQLTTALHLYSKGVSSKQLEESLDQSNVASKLPSIQSQSLYATAYLMSAFEEYDPKRSIALQSLEPNININQVPVGTPSEAYQIVFDMGGELVRPIIDKVVGKGVGIVKERVKDFALKAIKKGGKKLAKEAVKKGVGLAAKAGVKVAVTATAQALGTSVPIIGNIAAFIATEVLPRLLGAVKKTFGKIGEILTGEKDRRKQVMWIAGVGAIAFLGLGIPIAAAGAGLVFVGAGASYLGGVGIGAGISSFGSAALYGIINVAAPAIGIPLLISIIAAPLVVAFMLFVINSGAYVTPYAPHPSPGSVQSAYIGVEKVADPEGPFDNNELPLTIDYTITVTAKLGSLSNIVFGHSCSVLTDGSAPSCTAAVPEAPTIISPVEPYVYTYQQSYNSAHSDSFIIDTFTVTADVAGVVVGEQAAGSATLVIGDPPVLCPIIGGYVHYPSYNGTNETGHGSNAYWGSTCNYDIPSSSGCWSPSRTADPDGNNVCHYRGGECNEYGYAADFVRSGAGDEVLIPSIFGESITWNKISQFSNNGGIWGWGVTYRASDTNGNSFFIYITHLNNNTFPSSVQTGEIIGTLFRGLTNPHAHVEISVNGQWIRPDFLCGGIGP